MKYLKKLALVSDLTYNYNSLQMLPGHVSKIKDQEYKYIILNDNWELYIIHGALYIKNDVLYAHKDNMEYMNKAQTQCRLFLNPHNIEQIRDIIKPNSNYNTKNLEDLKILKTIYSIYKEKKELTNSEIFSANDIINSTYKKELKDTIDSYIGYNIYESYSNSDSPIFYIDATKGNEIDLDKMDIVSTSYDFDPPKADVRLNKFIWSHGLAAFSTYDSWKKNLISIFNNPEMQISCSRKDENLGPVGVYVMGDVVYASPEDIYSDKAKDSKRIWSPYYKNIMTKDNISQRPKGEKGKYGEIILTNIKVIGFWIKGNGIKYKNLLAHEEQNIMQLKKIYNKYINKANNWWTKYFMEKIDYKIKYRNVNNFDINEMVSDKQRYIKDDFMTEQDFDGLIKISRNLYTIYVNKRNFQIPDLLLGLEKIAQSKNLPITYLPQIGFNN